MFVSLTRLKLRSIRFLPFFAFHAVRTVKQIRTARGFITGELLPDQSWTYWTMTGWESQDDMRSYMTSGSHKVVMPHLLDWCDEASVAHWTQSELELPSWAAADTRMRAEGRPSKVRHPSPHHAKLTYTPPGKTLGTPIRPSV